MAAPEYLPEQLSRSEVDGLPGLVALQFGTNWCGWCRAGARFLEPALAARPDIRRILVEDGKGRPLGRSYRVKLWPTLILLADGGEVARVVRPSSRQAVDDALALLPA